MWKPYPRSYAIDLIVLLPVINTQPIKNNGIYNYWLMSFMIELPHGIQTQIIDSTKISLQPKELENP